jgi:hypothetical protein
VLRAIVLENLSIELNTLNIFTLIIKPKQGSPLSYLGKTSLFKLGNPRRHYTTSSLRMQQASLSGGTILLNPWFLTGFTDAEGAFMISISKDSRFSLG